MATQNSFEKSTLSPQNTPLISRPHPPFWNHLVVVLNFAGCCWQWTTTPSSVRLIFSLNFNFQESPWHHWRPEMCSSSKPEMTMIYIVQLSLETQDQSGRIYNFMKFEIFYCQAQFQKAIPLNWDNIVTMCLPTPQPNRTGIVSRCSSTLVLAIFKDN